MRIKRKKFEKTKNAKTSKYEKMPNKKVNRQTSFFCNCSTNLSLREGYGQRRQKKEKGNKCDRNEKNEEKKRDNR